MMTASLARKEIISYSSKSMNYLITSFFIMNSTAYMWTCLGLGFANPNPTWLTVSWLHLYDCLRFWYYSHNNNIMTGYNFITLRYDIVSRKLCVDWIVFSRGRQKEDTLFLDANGIDCPKQLFRKDVWEHWLWLVDTFYAIKGYHRRC